MSFRRLVDTWSAQLATLAARYIRPVAPTTATPPRPSPPCPPTPLVSGPCIIFLRPHTPTPLTTFLDRRHFRFPLRIRHTSPEVLVVDTDGAGVQALRAIPDVLRVERHTLC